MADIWYPGRVHDPAPSALWGTHAPGYAPKVVLHTTEGRLGVYSPDTRRGEARRYFGHTYWPTYTLALGAPVGDGRWHVYQHIPANRSARALANAADGVETNRANASQVEIAWKAAEIASLPREAIDELARLLAWEHEARGVPPVSPVAWQPYPASYGRNASQRLSPARWKAYAGVLGHMHAPENDHGDPGKFPIDALLSRARELTRGEAAGVAAIDEIAKGVAGLLQRQAWERPGSAPPDWHPPREAHVGAVLRRTYEMVGGTWADVGRVLRLVEGIAAGNVEVLLRNLGSPVELDRLASLASARADDLRRPPG